MTPSGLVSNALLLVGDTGTGKTSLLATLAEHVYRKFKLISRLYSWDTGGFGDQMEVLIRAGIVQHWKVRTIDPTGQLGLPTGTTIRATLGYWPEAVDEDGACEPNATLVPPTSLVWDVYCPQGHKVMRITTRGQLQPRPCPECKTVTTAQNASKIEKVQVVDKSFANVGAVMYDGLTSMSLWGIADLNGRAAKNELGGEAGNIRTVRSADQAFGTAGRAGIGFVQNRGYDWIANSLTIPNLKVPPTFTALELRATDEGGLPIYGPQLIGKAKTAEVPSWVGNCLGTTVMQTEKGMQHRLYLREYMTDDRIPHLCKVRALPGTMPEFLADDPGDQAFTKFSLGYFYELLDQAKGSANTRLMDLFPELKDGGKVKLEEGKAQEQVIQVRTEAAPPTPPVSPTQAHAAAPAAGQATQAQAGVRGVPQASTTVVKPAATVRPAPAGKPGVRPPAGAPPGARPRR